VGHQRLCWSHLRKCGWGSCSWRNCSNWHSLTRKHSFTVCRQ
ncbi:hypothetical protein DBR06_SOUSAS1210121, partial [Sousa chinensis]